jgi:hypothetical protein
MPGEQMATAAELRPGSIDGLKAKRRRRSLQRETQFYADMDGAVKFAKAGEPDLPNMPVVSSAERLPEVSLKPVARATPC